jgi:hypothetical protein
VVAAVGAQCLVVAVALVLHLVEVAVLGTC